MCGCIIDHPQPHPKLVRFVLQLNFDRTEVTKVRDDGLVDCSQHATHQIIRKSQQKNVNKWSHLVQLVFQLAFFVQVQVFFSDGTSEDLLDVAPPMEAYRAQKLELNSLLLVSLVLMVLMVLLAAFLASSLPYSSFSSQLQ